MKKAIATTIASAALCLAPIAPSQAALPHHAHTVARHGILFSQYRAVDWKPNAVSVPVCLVQSRSYRLGLGRTALHRWTHWRSVYVSAGSCATSGEWWVKPQS